MGDTRLSVTRIGLGLAALGRPAYINLGRDRDLGAQRSIADMERRCHALLDAAHERGIAYLDAARSYGYAERFLASWLQARGLTPGEVTVGSKWGYTYVGDWRMDAEVHEVKDHSLASLQRQHAESRELLGEHLSLYQIHSATLESGVLEDRAVLAELAALRNGGLVIGLSLSGPRQKDTLRRALAVEVDGVNPFACVQATFNALEPSVGGSLQDAHAAGWGVIVKEALANGRLVQRPDESPADGTRDAVDDAARRCGAPRDAIALAWALSHTFVDVVLLGAVTKDQLRSNLGALDLDLDDDDRHRLARAAEAPEAYWAYRSTLAWG